MALSDLDLGWSLRKLEEAVLTLNEARGSPESLKKYLVIRAIINARQSLTRILGIQELDQKLLARVDVEAPWEKVGMIRVFDSVVDFLQKNDVDTNTAMNLGELLVSATRNLVSRVRHIHVGDETG